MRSVILKCFPHWENILNPLSYLPWSVSWIVFAYSYVTWLCMCVRGIEGYSLLDMSLPHTPHPPLLTSRKFQLHFSPDLQKLLYDPPTSTPCLVEHLEQRKWRLQYYRSGGGGGASAGKKRNKPKTNQFTLTHWMPLSPAAGLISPCLPGAQI